MIRKVITTLGFVLLAVGMLACESSSSNPVFAGTQVPLEAGAAAAYTLTLSEEVSVVDGVDLKAKISIVTTVSGTASAAAPPVTAALGADNRTIDITFTSVTFAAGDSLKATIDKDAVQDTDGNKNAEIAVTVTVPAAE